MTLAGNGIDEPADLEGKILAAPDFDAGRQLFPAFAQATGIDEDLIEWMTVTPQLRETMLATGDADAITGFLTSGIQSLKAAGIAEEDIVVMRYPDYGVDLYSTSIITTQTWAAENPEAVTGIIRAVVRGHLDAIADPDAAIAALKARDPLIDEAIERERMLLSFNAPDADRSRAGERLQRRRPDADAGGHRHGQAELRRRPADDGGGCL